MIAPAEDEYGEDNSESAALYDAFVSGEVCGGLIMKLLRHECNIDILVFGAAVVSAYMLAAVLKSCLQRLWFEFGCYW